jgi:hypothetical protein
MNDGGLGWVALPNDMHYRMLNQATNLLASLGVARANKITLSDWMREAEEARARSEHCGFERGFREGECKQAILEIQGRERFLAEQKAKAPAPRGGEEKT